MTTSRSRLLAALTVCASGLISLHAQSVPALRSFTGSYFFGDSLTDSGNTFALTGSPPAPYFQGRVSNGPTYAEYLRPGLVAAATVSSNPANLNFAFAGATASTGSAVPNLTQQVGMFQARGLTGKSTDLFVVLAGANDVLNTISNPATQNGAAVEASARTAAAAVGTNVQSLLALGAKNIVVMNLPDISKTARFTTGSGAPAATLAANGSSAFNSAIRSNLAGISLGSDVTLRLVNLEAALNTIIRNASALGFTNTTNEVVGTLQAGGSVANPNAYVFWDGIHPTTAVHSLFASVITEVINPEFVLGAADTQRAGSQLLADLAADALDARFATLRQGGEAKHTTDGFVSFHFRSGGLDPVGYTSAFDYDAQVLTAGVDHRFSPALTAGVAFSADTLDAEMAGGGSYELRGETLSVYGRWAGERYFAEAAMGGGTQNVRAIRRATRLGGLRTSGETDGEHLGGALKVGGQFGVDGTRFAPFVGVRYHRVDLDTYQETGVGGLNFQFDGHTATNLTGLLGLDAGWATSLAGRPLQLGLSAVYQTELGDSAHEVSGRLADTVATTARIQAAGDPGETIKLGARVGGIVGKRWGWTAGYTGDLRSDGDAASQFSLSLQTNF